MDAEPDLPDIREDDPRWVRCAVYTRQSVRRPGDDPAVTSCAIQRTLCTEFIRNKTWEFWYPVAEHFDDEGESGATLERPGLAKLLRRVEEGDVRRVIVYRVDRLTRKLVDLARLAEFFERHHVGITIVSGNIDADAGSLAGLQVNMLATFAEWEREIIRERIADQRGAIKARGERSAGRVPLGYRTDRLTKQLVIDDRAAVTVRWFFDEAAKGTTTSDLVAKANKKQLAGKVVDVAYGAAPLDEPHLRRPSPRWRAGHARADRRAGFVRTGADDRRGAAHADTNQAGRTRHRRADGHRAARPVQAARAFDLRCVRQGDVPGDALSLPPAVPAVPPALPALGGASLESEHAQPQGVSASGSSHARISG
ncbi:MAG: recombinase family protein [Polyangiaceae bacterium]|nr:recombinase family protein [Polyangiaceae bacterium]